LTLGNPISSRDPSLQILRQRSKYRIHRSQYYECDSPLETLRDRSHSSKSAAVEKSSNASPRDSNCSKERDSTCERLSSRLRFVPPMIESPPVEREGGGSAIVHLESSPAQVPAQVPFQSQSVPHSLHKSPFVPPQRLEVLAKIHARSLREISPQNFLPERVQICSRFSH
jgi:hypothetical protein